MRAARALNARCLLMPAGHNRCDIWAYVSPVSETILLGQENYFSGKLFFKETSMSANTERGFIKLAPERRPRGVDVRNGAISNFLKGAVTFAKAVSAARDASYLAERYYAMNESELARLGLTRATIPARLLRVLSR